MSNYQEINDYIAGLQYEPEKVLAFEGNKVSNYMPKSGEWDNDTYVVVTRKKCTIEEEFDVSIPESNRNIVYTGGLVCANTDLIDGKAQAIGAKRGNVTLTLNLPGMTSDNSCIVEASYENVLSATNLILDKWYENYKDYCIIPANLSFESGIIYDRKQMQLKFGCDVGYLANKLGIDFNAIERREKSVYVAKYKQIYYTSSVGPYAHPGDAFDESVTKDDLIRVGVNEDNPPAYVGSVTYGREIYIKFESHCSNEELEAVLSGSVSYKGVKPNGSGSASASTTSNNINCTIIELGGNAENLKGVFGDTDFISAVNNIIFKDVHLSKSNPAYPLSYKVVFLKDNRVAYLGGASEYIEETYDKYSSGEIKLEHSGAYIAKFYVSWQEISGYDNNGNEIMEDKSWGQNGDHRTAGFRTVIPLGANARNINIKGQGATGLVWDKWHTPFDKRNLPLQPHMWVKLRGTTLNQWAETNL